MKQVFLSSTATEYDSLTIELNKPIKNDLVLDQTQENLYVMTTDKVMCLALRTRSVFPFSATLPEICTFITCSWESPNVLGVSKSKLMDLIVVTWRTVKSLMLSDWEWEVSSLLKLSYGICEKDEVEMFGTSMPWGQVALVLGVVSVGYQWMLQLPWVSFKSTSGFRLLAADIIW